MIVIDLQIARSILGVNGGFTVEPRKIKDDYFVIDEEVYNKLTHDKKSLVSLGVYISKERLRNMLFTEIQEDKIINELAIRKRGN